MTYAMALHKAQGSDFAPGLTYVAISRVTSLDGLLAEEPFDFE
jgi:ATP-dependent exoDNAse (exonuclease V) alpha subunit